jgi:hypothetical protein
MEVDSHLRLARRVAGLPEVLLKLVVLPGEQGLAAPWTVGGAIWNRPAASWTCLHVAPVNRWRAAPGRLSS